MDITSRFIEIVCSIDKNFVNKNSNDSNHAKHLEKNRQLSSKLRELVSSITCMRDYIKANARDYANILSSILSISSQMTDNERDQIDKDVQDFIKLGNDVIRILRVELKSKTSKQQYEHEMNAINMVEAYLGSINEMHNQNKQLRLRRKFFTQQFFRIDKNTISNVAQSKPSNNHKFNDEPFTEGSKKNLKQSSSHKNGRNGSIPSISSTNRNSKSYNDYYDTNDAAQTITEPLQPEERKQFQLEGKQMYEQLNSMNQEVMSITKKITEISKLQELFSENVLKQQCDLNNLNISTITSNESIREGNEQLREAMRNNAGFRVWILFFITTLAFVILFLDWYNP